jgi:hypothetical protein
MQPPVTERAKNLLEQSLEVYALLRFPHSDTQLAPDRVEAIKGQQLTFGEGGFMTGSDAALNEDAKHL